MDRNIRIMYSDVGCILSGAYFNKVLQFTQLAVRDTFVTLSNDHAAPVFLEKVPRLHAILVTSVRPSKRSATLNSD
jgi:hypothetical protein